ncbi:MAG: nickel pincer cofactor biosynthesis protein LarB [Planctomycetaceae bacterium]
MPVDPAELSSLLWRLQQGELAIPQAIEQLTRAGWVDDAAAVTAQVDLDRQRRCGFPEVVYAPGKTVTALVEIFRKLAEHGQPPLATRVSAEQAAALLEAFPHALHNSVARTVRLPPVTPTANLTEHTQPRSSRPATSTATSTSRPPDTNTGPTSTGSTSSGGASGGGEAKRAAEVAVISAGTSDRPVAEEAVETALWMGCEVDLILDVGVAGPHRLPAQRHRFERAAAVVVVAGMEAALPSVVGGYVACPVIGVPTSVGYGAHLGGFAALLGMLNSCAANVTVVNIDAGFKGGYLAGLIAKGARNTAPVAG